MFQTKMSIKWCLLGLFQKKLKLVLLTMHLWYIYIVGGQNYGKIIQT